MNIKFNNLINSFFLLLWFRLIQATLDPNFDYGKMKLLLNYEI